jgi:hypothetical protein
VLSVTDVFVPRRRSGAERLFLVLGSSFLVNEEQRTPQQRTPKQGTPLLAISQKLINR